MKRAIVGVSIGTLVLIVLLLAVLKSQQPHTLSPADLFDRKVTTKFARIELTGQNRKVIVNNAAILSSIMDAFRQPQDRGLRGGTTYDCLFILEDGSSVKATVYIYQTMDGFSVAVPHRSGLLETDPYYYNVRIGPPVDPQLKKLFETLTQDQSAGKLISF
jgi:hypothetical protein